MRLRGRGGVHRKCSEKCTSCSDADWLSEVESPLPLALLALRRPLVVADARAECADRGGADGLRGWRSVWAWGLVWSISVVFKGSVQSSLPAFITTERELIGQGIPRPAENTLDRRVFLNTDVKDFRLEM